MSKAAGARFFTFLAGLLIISVWLLADVTAQIRFPIGNDSIGYMSEATNLINGRGLVRVPNETELPDLDYAPTRYHPPGLGLAIASLAVLGVGVERAGLLISHLAYALLPFILLFTLRPILPIGWALAVTALAVLSPGMYLFGATINADVPTLLLLALATGLAIRAVDGEKPVGYLFAAGVLLGAAYVLRNSVTAVYAGLGAALLGAALLRQVPYFSAARYGAWVAVGSIPIVGLLFMRNYVVFGEMQPYVLMVGTHATLLDSFRVFLDGLISELTGSPSIGKRVAWDFKLLLLIGVPTFSLVAWGLLKQWRGTSLQTRFAILFGLLFSSASAAMLVIAHTYHGLDFGFLLRHMMQFAWIVLTLTVLAALGYGNSTAKNVVGLVFAVLLASRMWFIADDMRLERDLNRTFLATPDIAAAARPFVNSGRILTNQIRPALARDAAVASTVRSLPEDALILSNQGPLLGLLSDRSVRTIPSPIAGGFPAIANRVDQVFHDMHRDRPVFLVLVPDNGILHSIDHTDWKKMVVQQLPPTYLEISRGDNILVLRAFRDLRRDESMRRNANLQQRHNGQTRG